MPLTIYQLRLDVQRFLWPVYYIALVILYYIILYYIILYYIILYYIILYYAGPLSCILECNYGMSTLR